MIRRTRVLLLVLSFILGLSLPLFLGGWESLTILKEVNLGALALLLSAVIVGWNLNAARIRVLLNEQNHTLSQRKALGITISTEFAISATPAGSAGAPVFSWLLRKEGLAYSDAFAVFALIQLTDLLFFISASLILMLYWLYQGNTDFLFLQVSTLLLLLFFAALFFLIATRVRLVANWVGKPLRFFGVPYERRLKLLRGTLRFRARLLTVEHFPPRTLLSLFVLCSTHWLIRYSMLYFSAMLLGQDLSWTLAFFIQVVSLTAGQLVMLPGGSGGVELSSLAMLSSFVEEDAAAAIILLWRFIIYYWYLIVGAPVFALLIGNRLSLFKANQNARADET